MVGNRTAIPLCILSDAEGGEYEDADCHHRDCPLDLTRSEARHCPCKTRTEVGRVGATPYTPPTSKQMIRVLECLFPRTWTGETVRNPTAFAACVHRKARRK
jgi:hypothetical protein